MILVVLLYFLFASTFTLGKSALSYVSPFLFIGMRMILGGSLLLLYYRYIAGNKISLQKADYSLFVRIILFHIFAAYTLEFWALDYVTSAKACLLYNLSPFVTATFAYLIHNERLSYRQLAGLVIGFLAFIPVLITQAPTEIFSWHVGCISAYELALIGSVISSAYGWMIMKKLIHQGYSFIMVNGIGMLGGGFLAFILSLYKEGLPLLKSVPTASPMLAHYYGSYAESLIKLGFYSFSLILIANIICYNLYGYLLSHYSPTFLSFAGFMTPLFAALLGWLFLGEAVTWHFFATVSMVFCGLYLFYEKKTISFEENGL